ncbi:ATP-binding cassette domain-containing protein [Streptomyces armeniacus]|uniref:ATP-binding cassette domain-containing protein n=1 Tax=Streptomyces armeniacus TaxID=83291 RepID=A0A345XU17_9ACTN|nr:ATP-binding cassette domain-containing protein [Streptomyces armeniacus]AXK35133.1 ATP-binding cassette domain-containing protein [Streptomyces armeniacus]
MLSLTGLTRRYGSLTALDSVSLRLAPGARHAVIGPNGAGKTTLLNLIAGTERPTHGSVVLDGRDLTRTAPARRARRGIARSFQQPSVIAELTVLDNVVLAGWRHRTAHTGGGAGARALFRTGVRRRQRAEAAHRQLAAVGLAGYADHPASSLSHGQRRLLDLAAALATRPRVLLLDEPAAGLTDRDVNRLLEVLGGLPDDVAMLLVEHHTEVVSELADTVTVLVDGRELVAGPVQTALNHQAVRDAYLGTGADAGAEPGGAP